MPVDTYGIVDIRAAMESALTFDLNGVAMIDAEHMQIRILLVLAFLEGFEYAQNNPKEPDL